MKKQVLLVLFMLFGSFHFSCREQNPGGCDDLDDYPKSFSMKSIDIESILVGDFSRVDTSLFYPVTDIAKRIYPKDVEFYTEYSGFPAFSLFNEAKACSPIEPKATQYIGKIEVFNQTDSLTIDSQFIGKGTDIATFFSMKVNDRQTFVSVADFVLLKEKILHGDSYLLRFNKQVQSSTRLKFDLEITMNDGARFIFKNEVFSIR